MEKSVESNENTENTLTEQKLEKNKKVIKKSSEIKGIKKYNKNGDLIYNIDNIKEECKKKNGTNLIKYIMYILDEEREDLLSGVYEGLGKDFLLNKLYETLEIENKGGVLKKIPPKKKNEDNEEVIVIEDDDIVNERKTSGGVLFTLFKNDKNSRGIYKELSKKEFKDRTQRKKAYKMFQKLAL